MLVKVHTEHMYEEKKMAKYIAIYFYVEEIYIIYFRVYYKDREDRFVLYFVAQIRKCVFGVSCEVYGTNNFTKKKKKRIKKLFYCM